MQIQLFMSIIILPGEQYAERGLVLLYQFSAKSVK